ncbi:MAG: Gfo/Idh/MocA family protein [Spirochaetales bacterium]
MKRALIVGTGGIAQAHAVAYSEPDISAQAQLAAVVDVDRDRAAAFAEQFGSPRIYTDLNQALTAETPDLVHVCTPPGVHAEQSVAALRAGAWVLCEKPLCASLRELDEVRRAEEETGRFCTTVFQWRFGSGMQHVKRQIDAGVFGKPLVGVCNTLWYRDHAYYDVPWRGKWSTELGGPTMGHGIHIMDSFLWLMGEWTEVTAKVGTLDRDIEVEDVSMAIVRFASGAMATIVNSVLSPRQETYLRLDFQRATVEATGLYSVGNADWRWTAAPRVIDMGAIGSRGADGAEPADAESAEDVAARTQVEWSRIGPEVAASHTEQIRALYRDMANGSRPLTSGNEARKTISFLTAIYKSAFSGATVKAGEITENDPFYASLNGRAGR